MKKLSAIDNDLNQSVLSYYGDDYLAENDIFSWQYICHHLFRVGNVNPTNFLFLDDLEQNNTLQGQIYKEFLKRQTQNVKKVELSFLMNTKESQELKKEQLHDKYSVPELIDQDFLLLDLILVQKIITEHGYEYLSEYGKEIVAFVEDLKQEPFKEITISSSLIDEIIKQDQKIVFNKKEKIRELNYLIKQANWHISNNQEKIEMLEDQRERAKADSTYLSDYNEISTTRIAALNKKILYDEKEFSLLKKIKLAIFKFMNRSTDLFFNNHLPSLEKSLTEKLTQKAKEFQEREKKINAEIQEFSTQIQLQQEKIDELKLILEAQEKAEIIALNLTKNNFVLDERIKRDVADVAKRNNCIFLHSIGNENAGSNTPLKPGVSFEDKVDQIRIFSPSISCSSYKIDTHAQLRCFSGYQGVIVTSGKILSAGTCDIGTTVNPYGERQSQDLTSQNIDKIISDRISSSYDEFAIDETKICGLFINFDDIQRNTQMYSERINNNALISTIVKTTEYNKKNRENPLPIFLIKNGDLYPITPKRHLTEDEIERHTKIFMSPEEIIKGNQSLIHELFHLSAKTSLDQLFIHQNNLSLTLQDKLNLAERLIGNYKDAYLPMIGKKIENFKEKLSNLRRQLAGVNENNNHNNLNNLKR